jgi:uncharacterized membrane protein YdjX (TVP38/TMEM64 family)
MRRPTLVVLVVAVVAALLLGGRRAAEAIPHFAAWVQGLGALGALAFVLAYVVVTVALVPASLLTLAAGAVYGVARGIPLVLVGASLGATAAFLLSRHALRGVVERRLADRPRLAAVMDAVSRDGRRIAFLLRLSPVVPFGLLNYALGATRLRLADHVVALVGIVPGTALYVYYGAVAGSLAEAAAGGRRSPAEWALLGAGLLATLVATVLASRAARRALAEAAPPAEDTRDG